MPISSREDLNLIFHADIQPDHMVMVDSKALGICLHFELAAIAAPVSCPGFNSYQPYIPTEPGLSSALLYLRFAVSYVI